VNEISDELCADERVAECYGLWCKMRLEVLRTHMKNPPHPGKLSEQRELKRIRSIIIEEAAGAGDADFPQEDFAEADRIALSDDENESFGAKQERSDDIPEPAGADFSGEDETGRAAEAAHASWTERYKRARVYLYGADDTPRDFTRAFGLFLCEAEDGNALAMHDLGRMCADGLGTGKDTAASRAWYEKALASFLAAEDEKPHKYIEYRIGKMYAAGLGAERDYEKAARWFSLSASEGYKYARYSLAGLYFRGEGVPRDFEAALSLYEKAAAAGFPYADYELGKMYAGGIGTAPDAEKSASSFRRAFLGFKALETKNPDDKLLYRLGRMSEDGTGTDRDINAATAYYEKAAAVGNVHAGYRLALLILADAASSREKIAEAVEYLTEAAQSGNRAAAYSLAKLYRDGVYVQKDIVRAVRLFRLAAENEDGGFAAYALGRIFADGDDMPKDIPAAVSWFTRAAEQGNDYAQYRLGKMYLMGDDVPGDRESARRWLAASANRGNVYAAFLLEYSGSIRAPHGVTAATRLLRSVGRIFRDNPPAPAYGSHVDRKLRRRISEKKRTQGHARDDHEQLMNN
jgi:TPR repeat protein